MSDYAGKDEATLRKLLEKCLNFQERRKIRAALKVILDGKEAALDGGSGSASTWKRTPDLSLKAYGSSSFASRRGSSPPSTGSRESAGSPYRTAFRSEGPAGSPSPHRSPSPVTRVPRGRAESAFRSYSPSIHARQSSRDRTTNGYHEKGASLAPSAGLPARYDPLGTRAEPIRSSPSHRADVEGSVSASSRRLPSPSSSALFQTADEANTRSREVGVGRNSGSGVGSNHSSRSSSAGRPTVRSHSPQGSISGGTIRSRSPSPFLSRGRRSPISNFRSGGETPSEASRPPSGSSTYSSAYSTVSSSGYSSGAFSGYSSSGSPSMPTSKRPPPSPSGMGIGSAALRHRHSAAAVMLESETAPVRERVRGGDLESDLIDIQCCTSVEELQSMLPEAVTFRQRRAIKVRIRQLQEMMSDQGDVQSVTVNGATSELQPLPSQMANGSIVENGKVLTSVDVKAADIDIERLESLEELKQMLQSTDEPALKRRLRNAMRQLRQRLEAEKARRSERHSTRADQSAAPRAPQRAPSEGVGGSESGGEGCLLQFSTRNHGQAGHRLPRPLVVPRSPRDDDGGGNDGGNDVVDVIQRSRERLQRARSGSFSSSVLGREREREGGDRSVTIGRSSSFKDRDSSGRVTRSGSFGSSLLRKEKDYGEGENRNGGLGSSPRWEDGFSNDSARGSDSVGSTSHLKTRDSQGGRSSTSSANARDSVSVSSDSAEDEREDQVFSEPTEDGGDFLTRLKARLNASCITTSRGGRRGSEPVLQHTTTLQHRRGTLLSDSLLDGPAPRRVPGGLSQTGGDSAATAAGTLSSSPPSSPSLHNGEVSAAGEVLQDSGQPASTFRPVEKSPVSANGSTSPSWRSSLGASGDSGASRASRREELLDASQDADRSAVNDVRDTFSSALGSITSFAASDIRSRKPSRENEKPATVQDSCVDLSSSDAQTLARTRECELTVRNSAAEAVAPSDKADARSSTFALTTGNNSGRSPSIWSSSYRLQKTVNVPRRDTDAAQVVSVAATDSEAETSTDNNRRPSSLEPHADAPSDDTASKENKSEEVAEHSETARDTVSDSDDDVHDEDDKKSSSAEVAIQESTNDRIPDTETPAPVASRGRSRKVAVCEVFPGVSSSDYDVAKCTWTPIRTPPWGKGDNSSSKGDNSSSLADAVVEPSLELEQAFSALLDDIDTEEPDMSDTLGSTISDLNALASEMESGKSGWVASEPDVDAENNNNKIWCDDDGVSGEDEKDDSVVSSSAHIVFSTSARGTEDEMDASSPTSPGVDEETDSDEKTCESPEDQTDTAADALDDVDHGDARQGGKTTEDESDLSDADPCDNVGQTEQAQSEPGDASGLEVSRPEVSGDRKVSELDPYGDLEDLELMESHGAVVPLVDLHGDSPTATRTCAISMREEEDGSVTMRRLSKGENQQRVVTVKKRIYRTPSNARAEDRETVVETQVQTPEGTVIEKKDTVHTKRKITARGSNYYSRNALTTKKVRNRLGSEVVEHDVVVESENTSTSRGEAWGDRAASRITLGNLATLPMLEEGKAAQATPEGAETKTSQARMVLERVPSGGAESGEEEAGTEGVPARPAGSPEVLSPLKDASVLEGAPVVLECTLGGSRPIFVAWFRQEERLEEDGGDLQTRYDAATGKATLTLAAASLARAGVYCCVASNELGEAATKCQLSVRSKPDNAPTFLTGLSDLEVTEGHSVTMTCRLEHAEQVVWYKDGIIQRNSSDFKQTFVKGLARLEIGEVFLDDVGTYSCVAKNDLGETRSSCLLTVTACSSETTVVPMFLTKLHHKTVRNGEDMVLECDVIGSPDPSVTWLKDGAPLRDDVSSSESYDGRVACLRIEGMELKDAGKYECVAENPAGRVSMDASITVQVCNKAPVFVRPLADVTVAEGEEASLRCEVAAIPRPSLFWRKDGTLVGQTPDHRQSFVQDVASLHITSLCVQDSGLYECVARNALGEACCSCQLKVTGKAVAPQQPPSAPSDQKPAGVRDAPVMVSKTSMAGLRLAGPPPQQQQTAAAKIVQRALSFQLTHHRRAELARSGGSPLASSPLALPSGSQRVLPAVPPSGQTSSSAVAPGNQTSTPVQVPSTQPVSSKMTEAERHVPTQPPRQETVVESAKVTLRRVSSQSRAGDAKVTILRQEDSVPEASRVTLRRTASHSRADVTPAPGSAFPLGTTSTPSPDPPSSLKTNAVESLKVTLRRTASQSKADSRQGSGTPFHPPSPLTKDTTAVPKTDLNGAVSKTQHDLPSRGSNGLPPKGFPSAVAPRANHQSAAAPQNAGSLVSKLRQQFQANEETAQSGGSGLRRWHSLPPRQDKPVVIQRDGVSSRSQQATPAAMSKVDINTITDEDVLHKMLSTTEDFDERRKIRSRLKEVREKARVEYEERRKQRDAEAGDVVKKQFERAEELKRKKMAAYQEAGAKPTAERESDYLKSSEKTLQDMHRQADEDKKKRLEAYSKISVQHGTSTGASSADGAKVSSSTTVTTDGSKTTTTKTTETTVTKTSGAGGMQYGTPGRSGAEQAASQLTKQLLTAGGQGVSGRVTVKTESWTSREGLINKSEKTETWGGAKPAGARGAMAAFKQMDNTNNPQSANKPKGMARSPSAIKQMLLDWCKAKTTEYENIEITNFSSSWNNGMAFCALIHHFFPDAFDYSKLEPKNRRYNFTLAFDTAEKQADISPLLDVDDMVKMKNPDWKCVFCYVQSLYRHLHTHDANKAKETAEQ